MRRKAMGLRLTCGAQFRLVYLKQKDPKKYFTNGINGL